MCEEIGQRAWRTDMGMPTQWSLTHHSLLWALWPQSRGWVPPHFCLDPLLRNPCNLLAFLLHKHTLDKSPTQFTQPQAFLPCPWTGRTPNSGTVLWSCCSPATGNFYLTLSWGSPEISSSRRLSFISPVIPLQDTKLPAILHKIYPIQISDFSELLPFMPDLPPFPLLCKKPEQDDHLLKENGSVLHFLLQDHTANLTHH